MPLDLDKCAAKFSANTPEGEAYRSQWAWNGTVVGLPHNQTSQISLAGCLHLCGSGTGYYPWQDISNTITTWILPVVGTLLQAPFESNATRRTLLAITRWVGSPIASLSYVLWNIKVSAKASLMVDMAVKYDDTPDCKSDFGSMRDSMFLLLVMNQYELELTAHHMAKEAEGLLRIVLFSKDLELIDTDKTLRKMRRKLAREVREMRRRGAVPAFISTMWFLFAFALSIQDAFGQLGQNTTAHDLALGCLLAWFPILIMGSIVDRNPIAAEAIRIKLNKLVDHVRHAICDEQHRTRFINTFQNDPEFVQLKDWLNSLASKSEHMDNFFTDFAGQGRIRWHYGAAHPILSDIEHRYIADKGRNWLKNDHEARANLVLGPVNDEGLLWFDIREFWQVASAIIIVGGSCGGAFILSYFTPTVGLGCRSGGYTIFFCVSLGLLYVEMTVWLFLSPGGTAHERWRPLRRGASGLITGGTKLFTSSMVWFTLLFPWRNKDAVKQRIEHTRDDMNRSVRDMNPRRMWELFFFRPVETFNTIWLVYIVLSQVLGGYRNCHCVTSTWGGGGGYLDFNVQDTSNSKWVLWYWTAGAILTGMVLGLSMFYITVEWCQQSFLSTESYEDAMNGLRKTRKYRHWTFIFRRISRLFLKLTLNPLEKLPIWKWAGVLEEPQKTLLWSKENPRDRATTHPPSTYASPTIHLNDFPTIQDTLSQANLPFSPALPTHSLHRPPARATFDASLNVPLSPSPTRPSEDSSLPLIQRPSEARQNSEGRSSVEGRVSFEDTLSPTSPLARGGWLGQSSALYSREGYRRANSDPGSFADAVGALEVDFGNGLSDEDLERGRLHNEAWRY